jgi:phage tail sheath gpL-like
MAISFKNVPNTARASNTYIEFAGERRSFASLFIKPTIGLIGQYDPAKTLTDYEPIFVTSAEEVGLIAGYGSHAHRQALAFEPSVFLSGGGVYFFPVPDDGAAVAATETIIFTNDATSGGTFSTEIGGVLVQYSAITDDTPTVIGNALVTAITAKRDIMVTAVNVTGTVTITAKTKGTAGNYIKIVQNPAGVTQEDRQPAGVTVTIENVDGYLDGGSGDPNIHDVFFDVSEEDKLEDRWYTVFTMPYDDSTNIGILKTAGDGRADPALHKPFGAYIGYTKQTYTQAKAIPETINSEWIGTVWDTRCFAPAWELSASLVGRIAFEQNLAPPLPYKTTEIGLDFDRFPSNLSVPKLDALFRAGMGYCKVNDDGTAIWGDIALTYRKTATGGDTEEYFDAVSLHARQAKIYSIDQLFLTEKYAQAVVVANEDVTVVDYSLAPKDVVADLSKLIDDLWAPFAWTKNADDVIDGIAAEINGTFEGRIDSSLIDDEAKALRIIAVKYAFLF